VRSAYAGKPVFSRLISRLIYPTPVDGGLGVHVTLDLAGRMRFGMSDLPQLAQTLKPVLSWMNDVALPFWGTAGVDGGQSSTPIHRRKGAGTQP
jgi:hypothetical protein